MRAERVALACRSCWQPGAAAAGGDGILRGTGDLGIVVERAAGSLQVIETTGRTSLCRIEGLGDLSHASAVFRRDGRFAFVFGRDGGLTKVDPARRRDRGASSRPATRSRAPSRRMAGWSRSPTTIRRGQGV